jgi:hypothetical protein
MKAAISENLQMIEGDAKDQRRRVEAAFGRRDSVGLQRIREIRAGLENRG